MQIVHVIFSFNVGGSETMLIDIVNEQVQTDQVALVIVNDSITEDLLQKIDDRVEIVNLRRKPGSRSLLPFLRLNVFIWRKKTEVVHVHSANLLSMIWTFFSRANFMTVHALQVSLKYANKAACLFAISDAVKQDILDRGNYPVVVVPNGINTEKIATRQQVAKANCFRIIQVARLDIDTKGQDILIEALSILKQRGITDVVVDLIGMGPSENYLKNLVIDKSLENQVNFLGLRDRDFIYQHLKDYDLMCHPARYEGFGLTVAEGMAAGLPVLVSDEGGPFEIIQQGHLGWAFKMEDAVDCANRIEYIRNHYDEALKKVEPAYRHVSQFYSVKRMVADYRREYVKHAQ